MSRNFQKKNKDLVNLQVVPFSEVMGKSKNGKFRHKNNLKIFLELL